MTHCLCVFGSPEHWHQGSFSPPFTIAYAYAIVSLIHSLSVYGGVVNRVRVRGPWEGRNILSLVSLGLLILCLSASFCCLKTASSADTMMASLWSSKPRKKSGFTGIGSRLFSYIFLMKAAVFGHPLGS